MEENGPVSRSIERWEEGFILFKYTALFTVNELVERCDREQFNEKKSPTLSCELAIGVFCLFYSWRFISFCRCRSRRRPTVVAVSPFSRRRLVGPPRQPVLRRKFLGHPALTRRAGLMKWDSTFRG